MVRFFYPKLDRNRRSNYIFGINPSLIVVRIKILFSKFLSFISMEYSNEISSSKNK